MFDLYPASGPRLTVHLLPRAEGLTVRAHDSAGHSAEAHTVLQRAEDVLRMASQPGFHEDVGRGLFRTLLPGELGELYRAAYTQATLSGARLALDLHFDRALVRLARYPWELLHDGSRFLLRGGTMTLARTVAFPAPVQPYRPRGPLELLTATPQPKGQPALAPIGGTFAGALDDALRTDAVDVAQLFPSTWDALSEWLLSGGPDVLHFEGHGDFTRTGRLYFEDVRGGVDAVPAEDIGAACYSTALRMIALNTSVPSGAGMESALGSVAPSLIAAGVPAVVATQYSLPQAEATRFWRVVYAALLAGEDVESAVVAGRHALRRTPYWHAVALYRRSVPVPGQDAPPVPACADTAAPNFTQAGGTVRAGVWLRHAESPAPDPGAIARVIGAPLSPEDRTAEADVATPGDVPLFMARPGPVTVRIAAPGCVVHHGEERVLPFMPDGPALPVWFAVTPHEPGVRALTFTLQQGDRAPAAVTHLLRVDPPDDAESEDEVALLQSHGCARGRGEETGTPTGAASRGEQHSRQNGPAPVAGAVPDAPPPPDRRADLLDALPETESLRALAARGRPPASSETESAPRTAHPPPGGDGARSRRWWLLIVAAVLLGIVLALLVI